MEPKVTIEKHRLELQIDGKTYEMALPKCEIIIEDDYHLFVNCHLLFVITKEVGVVSWNWLSGDLRKTGISRPEYWHVSPSEKFFIYVDNASFGVFDVVHRKLKYRYNIPNKTIMQVDKKVFQRDWHPPFRTLVRNGVFDQDEVIFKTGGLSICLLSTQEEFLQSVKFVSALDIVIPADAFLHFYS